MLHGLSRLIAAVIDDSVALHAQLPADLGDDLEAMKLPPQPLLSAVMALAQQICALGTTKKCTGACGSIS